MRLTTKTADKIAKRYAHSDLLDELDAMIRAHGLDILKEADQRLLLVNLGRSRRERERGNIRSRAQYAAMRAELSQVAE